jgi:cytochrome c553
MNPSSLTYAIAALCIAAAAAAVARTGAAEPSAAAKADTERVKRGAYLVMIGSCNDCHTPMQMTPNGPVPDFSRALSGHSPESAEPSGTAGKTDLMLSGSDLTSFRMPYGLVYSRNLTPDKTGIGDWTETQFIKTLRTGRHQGEGRPLLPPMPWASAGAMTDEDLKAVFAYLKSLKPIANAVPEPKVPPTVIDSFAKTNQSIVAFITGKPAK